MGHVDSVGGGQPVRRSAGAQSIRVVVLSRLVRRTWTAALVPRGVDAGL